MGQLTKIKLLKYKNNGDSFSIVVSGFQSIDVVNDFIALLEHCRKLHISTIVLDFSNYTDKIFPNVIVPFKGIMDYFSGQFGFVFNVVNLTFTNLLKTGFPKSLNIFKDSESLTKDIFHRIVEFKTTEEIHSILESVFTQLQKRFTFPPGVLAATNWGLSEVMDNVIQHASASSGYVMLQITQKSKTLNMTVFDNGQGIYNSLKGAPEYAHQLRTHLEAIELSLHQNVTRNPKIGKGYGLWGLTRIIDENGGFLCLSSGSGSVSRQNGLNTVRNRNLFISDECLTTKVDIGIIYNTYLDMHKVFGDYETYEYVNRNVEKYEDEQSEFIVFPLAKESGFRTRTDGEIVRNKIINFYNISGKPVKIDFTGITEKVTSSFVDEVIAKLYDAYGFDVFHSRFRIVGNDDYLNILIKQTIDTRTVSNISKLLTT
ncbi:MAG: DUF4325 domain-containing protein [Firmicutes bacterium]|nr:DUF4325 domain-containing protein [Bacillota bacterium]